MLLCALFLVVFFGLIFYLFIFGRKMLRGTGDCVTAMNNKNISERVGGRHPVGGCFALRDVKKACKSVASESASSERRIHLN